MNAKQRFDGSTMVTMTPFVELIGPLGSDTRPSCRQIAYGSTTALRICFSIEDMQEILNPVVESICARILEQKVATDFRKLYPVGGLVKLTYYRNKLLDVFGNSGRFSVSLTRSWCTYVIDDFLSASSSTHTDRLVCG